MSSSPDGMEETNLGVTINSGDGGCVVITFDRSVTSVEFSNDDAQNFALLILDAVEEASKPTKNELN